jgi:hypothetical protein
MPDELSDPSPGHPAEVEQADSPVSEVVRAELRHAGRGAGAGDRGSEASDVERDAVEAIALEGFRPAMRCAVAKGERFPRDAELVRAFPQFFGLLLPLAELGEIER